MAKDAGVMDEALSTSDSVPPSIVLTEKEISRFWENVDVGKPKVCWNWKRYKLKKAPYGRLMFRRRLWLAHRIAFLIQNPTLDPKICVLHTCDNPSCCNPSHLFLGSYQDNSNDKLKKGRGRWRGVKGSANKHSKLKESDIPVILDRIEILEESDKEIAKTYGVHKGTINKIRNKTRWKHLFMTNSDDSLRVKD